MTPLMIISSSEEKGNLMLTGISNNGKLKTTSLSQVPSLFFCLDVVFISLVDWC